MFIKYTIKQYCITLSFISQNRSYIVHRFLVLLYPSFHTWHPRLARRKVSTFGEMGAAPVTITLTRPPRDSCRRQLKTFQNHSSQEHHFSPINKKNLPSGLLGYLHFVKDEFVPYAVIPDNSLLDLCTFLLNGKVQKPFLKWSLGPTLDLEDSRKWTILLVLCM